MKKLMLAAVLVLIPAPAYAGHGGYDERCENGSCSEREEDYEGAGCKYVCPSFDKSPVQDSFNIQVCVQPGSCTPEEKKETPQ